MHIIRHVNEVKNHENRRTIKTDNRVKISLSNTGPRALDESFPLARNGVVLHEANRNHGEMNLRCKSHNVYHLRISWVLKTYCFSYVTWKKWNSNESVFLSLILPTPHRLPQCWGSVAKKKKQKLLTGNTRSPSLGFSLESWKLCLYYISSKGFGE